MSLKEIIRKWLNPTNEELKEKTERLKVQLELGKAQAELNLLKNNNKKDNGGDNDMFTRWFK